MTTPPLIGRNAPALVDELGTLTAILDNQRATVIGKVTGLSDAQGRSRPVWPSTMTPMGLVKHLAAVERWWFSIDFAARDVAPPWPEGTTQNFDGFEFSGSDTMARAIQRGGVGRLAPGDRGCAEPGLTRQAAAGPAVQSTVRDGPHDRGDGPPQRSSGPHA